MNILLKEIFAGVFVSIACWNRPWFPRVQWQTFQIQQLCIHTQCSVILACHWWYKLFVHWWIKGIYFASFYFRVWDLTRKIRENKNPAKISTYTVLWAVMHKVKVLPCIVSRDMKSLAVSLQQTVHLPKMMPWEQWTKDLRGNPKPRLPPDRTGPKPVRGRRTF